MLVIILQARFDFTVFGHAKVHGFVTWFDVTFPKDVVLSTSPFKT